MKSIMHRIEYLGMRFLAFVAGRLGKKGRRVCGSALGRAAARIMPRLRRTAEKNLSAAYPEWTPEQVRRTAIANIANLGRVAMEFLAAPSLSEQELRDMWRVENTELLDRLLAEGKGVLLLSGHFANWEYSSMAMSLLGYKMHAIGRRLNNPYVDSMVNSIRTRFGSKIIGHRDAVRPVMRALKDGGMVGFLLDQRAKRNESVPSSFFGRTVATNQGLALLALRTGAPVVFSKPERDGDNFVLRFGPVIEPPEEGDRYEMTVEFTRKFDEQLEKAVRQRPEEWFWVHNRWKIPKAGFPR